MIVQKFMRYSPRRVGYLQLRCYSDKPDVRSSLQNAQRSQQYYLDAPIKSKSVHDGSEKKYMSVGFGSNQFVEVSDDKRKMLEAVFHSFRAPIRYGFAYGSGVFKQTGYSDKVCY